MGGGSGSVVRQVTVGVGTSWVLRLIYLIFGACSPCPRVNTRRCVGGAPAEGGPGIAVVVAAMATTAMKGLVGAAQANVRAEEESMDPVKLIASDGTEVILDRRAAMVSGTIKAMLAGPGASAAPFLRLAAI